MCMCAHVSPAQSCFTPQPPPLSPLPLSVARSHLGEDVLSLVDKCVMCTVGWSVTAPWALKWRLSGGRLHIQGYITIKATRTVCQCLNNDLANVVKFFRYLICVGQSGDFAYFKNVFQLHTMANDKRMGIYFFQPLTCALNARVNPVKN